VAKVRDGALRTATGCFTDTTEIHGSFRSLRVFLGVVSTAADYVLCLYASPIYSIALTIVHFDGTSILSLHNTFTLLKLHDLCLKESYKLEAKLLQFTVYCIINKVL
jgi:hypothetical protein